MPQQPAMRIARLHCLNNANQKPQKSQKCIRWYLQHTFVERRRTLIGHTMGIMQVCTVQLSERTEVEESEASSCVRHGPEGEEEPHPNFFNRYSFLWMSMIVSIPTNVRLKLYEYMNSCHFSVLGRHHPQ